MIYKWNCKSPLMYIIKINSICKMEIKGEKKYVNSCAKHRGGANNERGGYILTNAYTAKKNVHTILDVDVGDIIITDGFTLNTNYVYSGNIANFTNKIYSQTAETQDGYMVSNNSASGLSWNIVSDLVPNGAQMNYPNILYCLIVTKKGQIDWYPTESGSVTYLGTIFTIYVYKRAKSFEDYLIFWNNFRVKAISSVAAEIELSENDQKVKNISDKTLVINVTRGSSEIQYYDNNNVEKAKHSNHSETRYSCITRDTNSFIVALQPQESYYVNSPQTSSTYGIITI